MNAMLQDARRLQMKQKSFSALLENIFLSHEGGVRRDLNLTPALWSEPV